MDVKEAFISRRSVRRFLPDPIPKDKIKNIDTVCKEAQYQMTL